MDIAKSDIASAKKMLDIKEWNWAHNAAYNAMLQAGRALMFSKGYRPRSEEHHLAVISFMQAVYSAKLPPESLQAFDKARKRRNESLYDRSGSMSESQSRNLVEKADKFVSKAQEILSRK
ncbi:MAG: HEPN domain-containing protein [Thaumarchaeota archaeon]|nr:HEPN domain-containing protein [Nitrososphaerota archaeon]